MAGLVPLSFAAPWMLLALLGLPAIWWLLRVTPPAPRRLHFPAVRLILGIRSEEESPAHTPWWVLVLRLALAAFLILGLSGPTWNAARNVDGTGPVVLVIDNTWAAASTWDLRTRSIRELIDEAGSAARPLILLPTAPTLSQAPLSLLRASEARELVGALTPAPFLADHEATFARLDELRAVIAEQRAEIIWLSDGLETAARARLADGLAALGHLTVISDADSPPQLALRPPSPERNGFLVNVTRAADASSAPPQAGYIRAVGASGRTLTRTSFAFDAGTRETQALLEMPLELRNETTRIEIDGAQSAGEVVLVDDGARRRAVGLVSGASAYDDQPLLSELFYLQRALEPFAEVRDGAISDLLASGITVLILADVGRLSGDDYDQTRQWLEAGGVLLRFAGPRLAAQADDLLPVVLRAGDRSLGGALAWSVPQGLLPFDTKSPFAGLDISEEVRVSHQVLAEPELELAGKTWARLTDGTPLVTGERRGEGWSILFHVTANQDWSTLAASGLYVEMLRRLLRLSGTMVDAASLGEGRALLPPVAVLDGYGRLQTPPPTAEPITASGLRALVPSPRHPPGLYGAQDAAHALNPVSGDIEPAGAWPSLAEVRSFRTDSALTLKPLLLAAALLLFLVDMLLGLVFAGHLRVGPSLRRAASPALMVLLASSIYAGDARAQGSSAALSPEDIWAVNAASELHLAYVITGDAASDDMARAGLEGLTRTLFARTTVEPEYPIGVDLEIHELAFFPLLYWRVSPDQGPLSPRALERLSAYMRNGGTVLIDTADQDSRGAFAAGGRARMLRRLIADLDVPPLAPVPEHHVLTRAFYLLDEFPGRYAGGDLWVEAPTEDGLSSADRDGVSPILIGSNDYAAAWATDDAGRPLATVTPGGARQREIANRFGVNLVMYALTGNYKADQVHVPALLERLGQ